MTATAARRVVPPGPIGAPVAAPDLYRRWLAAMTLGELAGFAVPALAWGGAAVAGLPDVLVALAAVAGGAGEGAVLGWAQARALRRALPALDARAWVRRTAGAAALAWAIGMVPSTFHDQLRGLPPAVLVVLAAVGATALLCSIGFAQATVLRRHVLGAGRWIPANVLGWIAGLPLSFAAMGAAPDEPAARIAFAVAGGAAMGAAVAAVTGAFLVALLRRPRPARRAIRSAACSGSAAAR